MTGNHTVPEDGTKSDLFFGLTLASAIVVFGLAWCCAYACRRRRLRKEKSIEVDQKREGYDYIKADGPRQANITDPLEKKPYTQMTFPSSSRKKDKTKYGVCQYRIKQEAIRPIVLLKAIPKWNSQKRTLVDINGEEIELKNFPANTL